MAGVAEAELSPAPEEAMQASIPGFASVGARATCVEHLKRQVCLTGCQDGHKRGQESPCLNARMSKAPRIAGQPTLVLPIDSMQLTVWR